MISQRNPFWDEFGNDAGRFNRFIAAVADVSSVVILRFVQQVRSRERAKETLVRECDAAMAQHKRYVVLDTSLPAGRLFADEYPELLFTVYPSARNAGNWCVAAIKENPPEFKNRMDLPESWLTNPPEGCTFCHKARFTSEFTSRGAAVNALEDMLR